MANVNQTLNRIDPTEGLTEYVQAIKPYHSKILDVLVEYVYTDAVSISVIDREMLMIGLAGSNVDVKFHDQFATPPYTLLTSDAKSGAVYACGYGYKWSEYGITAPEVSINVSILSANADKCVDDATSQNPNSPIFGTACLSNSFLVQSPPSIPFSITVSSVSSDEFVFTLPYNISGIDQGSKTFKINENLVTGSTSLPIGSSIYITGNDTRLNHAFEIVSIFSLPTGGTGITVKQPIPLNTVAAGVINIPASFDSIPYWESGIKVQVNSVTGTIPSGINTTIPLYFIPSSVPGTFKLSPYRYPREITDYTNVTNVGSGPLTIIRQEPFVPGQTIDVSNTYLNHNDGRYIIGSIVPEGNNFRLFTLQPLTFTTPSGSITDGLASATIAGYDLPAYCGLAAASPLHADTFIHEKLQLIFSGGSDIPDQGYGEMEFGSEDTYGVVSIAPVTGTSPIQPSTTVTITTGFDIGAFGTSGIGQ